MEAATVLTNQLMGSLKKLTLEATANRNEPVATPSTKHDIDDKGISHNYTSYLEKNHYINATPHSVASCPTELRKRRKHCKHRILPYTARNTIKARKSLNF